MKKLLLTAQAAMLSCASMLAQAPGTGPYPFASFDNRGFDSINLGNNNIRFTVPIVSLPGRGMGFNYGIQYEGLIWNSVINGSTLVWTPAPTWGFTGVLNGTSFSGFMTHETQVNTDACPVNRNGQSSNTQTFYNYAYQDPYGAVHGFNYTYTTPCVGSGSGATVSGQGPATDGSGYSYNGTLTNRNGVAIRPGYSSTGQDPSSTTDTNGNVISFDGTSAFTDTRGVTALTISGSSPVTFTYPVALQSNGAPTASVVLSYRSYTVRTNFQAAGIVEYGSNTVNLVDRITLADGSFYSFGYEGTPGATDGAVTGRLASVMLPTGGTINYSYTPYVQGSPGGINTDGTPAGLTRATSDGTKTYNRNSSQYPITTETVTDEKNNETDLSFIAGLDGNTYETGRSVYQGANSGPAALETVTSVYNSQSSPTQAIGTISEVDVTTSYNGGSQSQIQNSYDGLGNLSNSAQYGGGTLMQTTAYIYNIDSEATSIAVTDGAQKPVFSEIFGYDESTPTATSGIPQHGGGAATRGNQTSVNISAGSATLTSGAAYYDTGMPVSTTAVGGYTTSYAYDPTQTFATTTTLPTPPSGVVLSTSASYDPASGAPLSLTGLNAEQTNVMQYDPLLRPTQMSTPPSNNGAGVGQTTASYTPNQISINRTLSSTQTTDQETYFDSFGRTKRVAVSNGTAWYLTDSCYDPAGLLQYQSVPYVSSTQNPSSYNCSAGTATQYTYDALNRTTSVANPDGSTLTNTYNGRAMLVSSSNGVSRLTQYDLLGRVASICEVSSGTTVVHSGPAGPCGGDLGGYTGFLTNYSYDLANHTTTVSQGDQQGSFARTFVTDAAGRTAQVTEPERGTTNYNYAYNSTGLVVTRVRPAANQTNATVKTATTTQYDGLGRAVSVTYNDGQTPGKFYLYDKAYSGDTIQNKGAVKGQMSNAYSLRPDNSLLFAREMVYDSLGDVTETKDCLPGWCGNSSYDVYRWYTYDLASEMAQDQYASALAGGSPVAINYSHNLAGQLTQVQGGQGSGSNGNTPYSADPSSMTPFGPLTAEAGNGLFTSRSYDSQGRLNRASLCGGIANLGCSGGTFYYDVSATTIGNEVSHSSDSVLGQQRDYTYDEFGRLSGLTTTPNTGTPIGLNFVYDRYGNRWQQNVTAGSAPSPQPTFNTANNQVTSGGYLYDAAGNVINDGPQGHAYTYDAENNLTQVDGGPTATFVYDTLNERVEAVTAQGDEHYGFDVTGRRSTSWNSSGGLDLVQYYAGSSPAAYWLAADGNIHFEHQDWLGTERMRTTSTGGVEGTYSSLPFGDALSVSGTDADPAHFALLDHDLGTSSGLEHASFREYSSTAGRWMSPDPYDGSYSPGNPQSFNRYEYVLSDVLSAVDPAGLDTACISYHYSTSLRSPGHSEFLSPSHPADSGLYTVCFDIGGFGAGGGGGGGGGGGAAGHAPSKPGCSTVLPNGKTLGQYINQGRAQMQASKTPLLTFASIARDYGQIDFKNGAGGRSVLATNLGQDGNFAYYAIGSGFLSPNMLDFGASVYAVAATVPYPGHSGKPFSTIGNGPMLIDDSAASMRSAGLATPGCPR